MSSPAPRAEPPPEWTSDEPAELTLARVIHLGFDGDDRRFREFIEQLTAATPLDVQVILRGSAVTGKRWHTEIPFDADGKGTSDLDVTFVGGDLMKYWESFHITGLHSVPLSEEHPDACPEMVPLRNALCRLAGRPVNLQATRSLIQFLRDFIMDQPYLVLVEKREP